MSSPLPTSSAINEVSYVHPMILLSPGFLPNFEQKTQGLFKDFQGHISYFSIKDSIQCKKRALSLCLF